MYKLKHPPSHFIICSTSGGLDRTLRKIYYFKGVPGYDLESIVNGFKPLIVINVSFSKKIMIFLNTKMEF